MGNTLVHNNPGMQPIDSILDCTPDDILDSTVDDILDCTPDDILDFTPDDILVCTLDDILDSTPDDLLDEMLLDISIATLCGRALNEFTKWTRTSTKAAQIQNTYQVQCHHVISSKSSKCIILCPICKYNDTDS